MEVVVISDTHLRSGIDGLDEELLRALTTADAIVHAGDIMSQQALDELGRLGTLHAVLGNNDAELRGMLPEEALLVLEGVKVAVVHDSGRSTGRARRLADRYPGADVVVFGHSHIPSNELGVGGQLLFNPGSPTQRRTQPRRTFGRLVLSDGEIVERRIEALG